MKVNVVQLVKESIEFALKKNKWLWVFGMLVATLTSGSISSFSNLSNILNNDTSTKTENNVNWNEVNDFLERLENQIQSPRMSVTTYIDDPKPAAPIKPEEVLFLMNLLKDFPTVNIIGIGITAATLILIGWVINMLAKSWAVGSLIKGIEMELNGETQNISSMSRYGKDTIKQMVLVQIIPAIIGIAILGLLVALTFSTVLTESNPNVVLAIIIGVFTLFGYFLFASVRHLSMFLVSIKNLEWLQAFKQSFSIVLDNLITVIFINVSNCLVGCVTWALFISVAATVIIGGSSSFALVELVKDNTILSALILSVIIILGSLVIIATLICVGVLTGIVSVYNTTTWVKFIKGITENGQSK